MFRKKRCRRCKGKIKDSYDFCPYCGKAVSEEYPQKDWGILGKNDFLMDEVKMPMGLNTIFNSLLKNLNKQFRELDKEISKKQDDKKGISISISTSGKMPPKIRVDSFGENPKVQKKISQKKISLDNLSKDKLKKISELPKKEPSTNIRRFSDKVIYEINMPGVSSIEDISIIPLEDSIEIKALAKDKAYFKTIPINLPIRDYNLSKGRLILELDAKD